MKKLFLFAALFAAVTMSAKDIVIDLSTAVAEVDGDDAAVPTVKDGVLTVTWTATAGWNEQGVAFDLGEITKIESISFEYKGDGVAAYAPDGVCLYPRLRDSEGNRWYKKDYWPNVSNTEWQTETMLPDNCPWDEATYKFGDEPFVSLAFVVNPSKAGNGVFYLRNVKITVPDETAIDNTVVEGKAVKVIRDGQVMILRDGKAFNALGVEMK